MPRSLCSESRPSAGEERQLAVQFEANRPHVEHLRHRPEAVGELFDAPLGVQRFLHCFRWARRGRRRLRQAVGGRVAVQDGTGFGRSGRPTLPVCGDVADSAKETVASRDGTLRHRDANPGPGAAGSAGPSPSSASYAALAEASLT